MRADSVCPTKLDRQEVAAWRALLAADPVLSSPYLTPEWAQTVAQARTDARVVVFRNETGPVGFLPVQRNSSFTAMPLGGPICDYQAVICAPDTPIDMKLALKALNVHRIDFTCALSQQPALAHCVKAQEEGHVVNFADGWDAYQEERRTAGSQVLKRVRKKYRKFQSTESGVSFEAFAHDREAFDTLLSWKRAQHQRTGSTDILSRPWIRDVISRVYDADTPAFGGELFTLRANGELAAALFCLRAGKTLHAWYVGHCERYEKHSPGLILFTEAIHAAADAGFTEMDLGAGDYRFKQSLANASHSVGPGFAGQLNMASAWRAAQFGVRNLAESMPIGRASAWPGKAMRRLDVYRGMVNASDAHQH